MNDFHVTQSQSCRARHSSSSSPERPQLRSWVNTYGMQDAIASETRRLATHIGHTRAKSLCTSSIERSKHQDDSMSIRRHTAPSENCDQGTTRHHDRNRNSSSTSFDELIARIRAAELNKSKGRKSVPVSKQNGSDTGARCDRASSGRNSLESVSPSRCSALFLPENPHYLRTWRAKCRIPSTKYEHEEDMLSTDGEITHDRGANIVASTELERKPFNCNDSTNKADISRQNSMPIMTDSTTVNESPRSIFASAYRKSRDFAFHKTPKCLGCATTVFSMEEVPGPQGTRWHKKCLKCKTCRKQMDSSAHFTETSLQDDGAKVMHLYCRDCWRQHHCIP